LKDYAKLSRNVIALGARQKLTHRMNIPVD
jgi:hypothetical protein